VAIDLRFHSLQLSEKLVSDAIAVAKAWRADHVCLHVQSGAIGVARLYESFGFKRAPEGDRIAIGNQIEGYLLTLVETQ
jgi:ribosomal protein S18 acetylase RimI-like enzyme